MSRWLVTGGAGFIGSSFVRTAVSEAWADEVVVLDALTYAGNLENLQPVEGRFEFVRGDVADPEGVARALKPGTTAVFHFAAESHVDRSIAGAAEFVRTNVAGTQVLLDAAREVGVERFVHISTDEVYGSLELGTSARFNETTPVDPTSPYAASKAAADHMVLAAHRTHHLDAVVTRCSNNYGPYQFPEKFIPLFVTNALRGEKLPLYGDGLHVRDWIHVDNHVHGVKLVWERGMSGEVYNLGGECERANRDIAMAIVKAVGADESLIQPVRDRPAHDRRYAIDPGKARALGFDPGPPIEERMPAIVEWYRSHAAWWERIKAGEYRSYYERMYRGREV